LQCRTWLLCEHASVNGGMITIVNGGGGGFQMDHLPNAMQLMCALVLHVEPGDPPAQKLDMWMKHVDSATVLHRMQVELRFPQSERPANGMTVPYAIDLRGLMLEHEGVYDFVAEVDGDPFAHLSFEVHLKRA
jgi:hypothetical protein